jgi:hypothetical protein
MSITMELNGSPAKKGGTIGPTGLMDVTYDADSNPPILEVGKQIIKPFVSQKHM